jgi:hypothetical protein
MRIYTHVNVDLDAVCSVWAAREFIPGAGQAPVIFRPANWDGEGLEEGDLALDIPAGGRGIKGEKDADGRVHSCFATLVKKHASPEDQWALQPLVDFVDAQDTHGSAVKFLAPGLSRRNQAALASTGINAVLRALQSINRQNDLVVCKLMWEILSGLLKSFQARQRAELEADRASMFLGNTIALIENAREFSTNGVLFERGVRFILYVDGNNLGLVREGTETLRMDHPTIRRVVENAGEAEEWFAHPAGFLFCRGSRKAPATEPSRVYPKDLIRALSHILQVQYQEEEAAMMARAEEEMKKGNP